MNPPFVNRTEHYSKIWNKNMADYLGVASSTRWPTEAARSSYPWYYSCHVDILDIVAGLHWRSARFYASSVYFLLRRLEYGPKYPGACASF